MNGMSEEAAIDGGAAKPARRGGSTRLTLDQMFGRLDVILDAEREALEQGRLDELDDISRRKSQCLLDLTRLSKALDGRKLFIEEGSEAIMQEAARIRTKLADSETMLKRYVEAAHEIAALVAEGLRASESDGTYAEAGPFGRYGR